MKIAIYGGSFNPPHLGHVEVAMTVYRELSPDIFFIVPDNEPPHKELEEGSPSAQQRLELCELAFSEIPEVQVSDMELIREGKSYTADTITKLREEYSDDEIYLIMGTDMFLSLDCWYRFEYLIKQCVLTVFPRTEDDMEDILSCKERYENEFGANIQLLPHVALPISSSEVREKLRLRLGAELVDDRVYSHIIKNGYYEALPELSWLREKSYSHLKESRIGHVAGCESEAVLLAMHWGENPEKAATAGILHDITKRLSPEEQLKMCDEYGIICDELEKRTPKILHAKTGAALARELFGVSDSIYEAIRWHTTGKPDMSLLEKITYLADYIEPTRVFEGVEELRKLAYEDIDEAMRRGLEMSVEDLNRRGIEPHHDTLDALYWYTRAVQEN